MPTKHLGAVLGVALALAVTGCNHDDDDNGTPVAGPATGFVFSPMAVSSYQRVDRKGMPVINTAVINSKNAYNAADPADDGSEPFISEIVANVGAYHTALDDELTMLGLDPATNGESVAQAAPLILPDVLVIDPSAPSGFPNGRRLQDQAPDVTLAVVLLDLGNPAQSATTFADLPLNPPANDKAFLSAFPYLAAPHTP